MIGAGRFLFALVSPCLPCVKLSCKKGLCASGCFFVVTTSFSLAGLHSLTFCAFGFGGLLRVFVVVFGGVFGVCVCVCVLVSVFAPATVSPLVLRPTRTAYCAADVVKRRRFKKKKA